jgi:hypothetical protein
METIFESFSLMHLVNAEINAAFAAGNAAPPVKAAVTIAAIADAIAASFKQSSTASTISCGVEVRTSKYKSQYI